VRFELSSRHRSDNRTDSWSARLGCFGMPGAQT